MIKQDWQTRFFCCIKPPILWFFFLYVITRKVFSGTFCPLQPNTIGEGPTNNWSKQRESNFVKVEAELFKWRGVTKQKNTVEQKNTEISSILTRPSWLFELGKVKVLFFVWNVFSLVLNFSASTEWKLYSKHIYWRLLAGLSSEALFGCLSDSGISHQVQQQLCPWDWEGKLQKMILGRCRVGHWASQRFKETAIESGLERPPRCHLILGKVRRGKIFANV